MKAKDLATLWGAPDNGRLTAKQYSFRLPVHVAAKIAALCEMYPQKNRTQIVADLLSTALSDLESGLTHYASSQFVTRDDDGREVYVANGPAADFRRYTNKHFVELEKELGVEDPKPFYQAELFTFKDEK